MNSFSHHNWYFDKCCGKNDDIARARTHTSVYRYIPGRAVINFIIIIIIIIIIIQTDEFNTCLVRRKRLIRLYIYIDRDVRINNVYYLYLIISISQLHHMRCFPADPPPCPALGYHTTADIG
jgi:hypothetical protein